MKLSIIIPVYNGEKYLSALFSNLRDTCCPFSQQVEILFIDDGSTDASETLIKQFSKKSGLNVKCIHQSNSGEGEARNAGITIARGDYILFLDCDDFLSSEGLSHFIVNDSLGYDIYCYSYMQRKANAITYRRVKNLRILTGIKKDIFTLNRKLNYGIGSTYVKRTLLTKLNIKFKTYKNGADNEFFRQLLLDATSIIEFDLINFEYMLRPTSARTNIENRIDTMSACDATWNQLKNLNTSSSSRLLSAFTYHVLQEILGLYIDFYREKALARFWQHMDKNISVHGLSINLSDFIGYRQFRRLLVLVFFCYFHIAKGRK